MLLSTSVPVVPVAVPVAIVLALLLVTAAVILGVVILLRSHHRKTGTQIYSMSHVCVHVSVCLRVHASVHLYLCTCVMVKYRLHFCCLLHVWYLTYQMEQFGDDCTICIAGTVVHP